MKMNRPESTPPDDEIGLPNRLIKALQGSPAERHRKASLDGLKTVVNKDMFEWMCTECKVVNRRHRRACIKCLKHKDRVT